MSTVTEQQGEFAEHVRLSVLAEKEFPYALLSEFYWASDEEAKAQAMADAKSRVDELRAAFILGAKKGKNPPTAFDKLFDKP
jgi:hypothetical protein